MRCVITFALGIIFVPLLSLAAVRVTKADRELTNNNWNNAPNKKGMALNAPIRVGHIDAMSGAEASFGEATDKGIRLAASEVNSRGGVLGKKIEIITLDNQGKADESVTAITKLVAMGDVVGVIGESTSTRSLAMAPIAERNHMPMVSSSATHPMVTQVGKYIFRVCFTDPFQGQAIAKFVLSDLKLKKVAIFKDVKSDYSLGLANYFMDALKKGGGEITSIESYSAGEIDFRAQLTSIRSKRPEAIFIPGFYTDVGLIARQARELGLTQTFLGGDGWDSPILTEIGKKAIEGAFFSNHYTVNDDSPLAKAFFLRYQTQYGVLPNGSSALGYDAANVLFDAISRAGSENRAVIRDKLATTRDFPGVTGSITIDKDRNAQKPAVIIKIVNGKFMKNPGGT